MTEKPIYEIKEINSYVETGEISSNILEFLLNKKIDGYIVCWLFNEVIFGKLQKGKLITPRNNETIQALEKYLIKLRLFNEKEELYVFNKSGKWCYRYRKDNVGEKWEVIDTDQIMYGTEATKLNDDFFKISEERGICYIVPKEFLGDNTELSATERLVLKTRNYIKYTELGQTEFVDNRFLEIVRRSIKDDNKARI